MQYKQGHTTLFLSQPLERWHSLPSTQHYANTLKLHLPSATVSSQSFPQHFHFQVQSGLMGSKLSTPADSGMSLDFDILKAQVYKSVWVPKCMGQAEFQYLITIEQSTQKNLASYLGGGEPGEPEFSSIPTGCKDPRLSLHRSPWDTQSARASGVPLTQGTPESQTGALAPLLFMRLSLAEL